MLAGIGSSLVDFSNVPPRLRGGRCHGALLNLSASGSYRSHGVVWVSFLQNISILLGLAAGCIVAGATGYIDGLALGLRLRLPSRRTPRLITVKSGSTKLPYVNGKGLHI
ncbi:hypothetical protein JB92DRAFT_364118 [Gautieria morchelliformis]|nr:hypothetical protein JB92DRAFT_364118 [Gautieria morchelliformis]